MKNRILEVKSCTDEEILNCANPQSKIMINGESSCKTARPIDCYKTDCNGAVCWFSSQTKFYILDGEIEYPCEEFGCPSQSKEIREEAKKGATKQILDEMK